MAIIEITKAQKEQIVYSLKSKAEAFRKGAYHLDESGHNCLTKQQSEMISALPEDMRERAKYSLLKNSEWQEKMYKEYVQLADLLTKSELFIKKD